MFKSMKPGDYYLLAKIYLSILSDEQVKQLYVVMNSSTKMVHIPGTYPLGMYYVYNFPMIFQDYADTLKNMDENNKELIPLLSVITSKYILRNAGRKDKAIR